MGYVECRSLANNLSGIDRINDKLEHSKASTSPARLLMRSIVVAGSRCFGVRHDIATNKADLELTTSQRGSRVGYHRAIRHPINQNSWDHLVANEWLQIGE